MTKDTFLKHFNLAIEDAVKAVEAYVTERVVGPYNFAVIKRDGALVGTYDKEACVERFYKDGALPQWINMLVADIGEGTLFQIEASERYTKNDEEYSGQMDGYPPFHVLGPGLPQSVRDGMEAALGTGSSDEAYAEYFRKHPISIKDCNRNITL